MEGPELLPGCHIEAEDVASRLFLGLRQVLNVRSGELVWFDRRGNELGRPGVTGVITTIDLSPDDTSVVYDLADPKNATFDIWQLVFSRRGPDRLTLDPANDLFPLWRNETQLDFMSDRGRSPQVSRCSRRRWEARRRSSRIRSYSL